MIFLSKLWSIVVSWILLFCNWFTRKLLVNRLIWIEPANQSLNQWKSYFLRFSFNKGFVKKMKESYIINWSHKSSSPSKRIWKNRKSNWQNEGKKPTQAEFLFLFFSSLFVSEYVCMWPKSNARALHYCFENDLKMIKSLLLMNGGKNNTRPTHIGKSHIVYIPAVACRCF